MLSLLAFLVTTPVTFILLPLLIGLIIKNRKWKRGLYATAILLALIFTNTPLLKIAEEQWYKEYDRPLPEGKTYKYGIVLGGYSFWDWERNRPEFSGIADRLTEGIRLYKCGRIDKLVLASDGSIIQSKDGKGLQGNPQGMMKYLNELGIPQEDIIMETFANNTRENVTFTKKLLGKEMDTASIVIITSAIQHEAFGQCFSSGRYLSGLLHYRPMGKCKRTACKLHAFCGYAGPMAGTAA